MWLFMDNSNITGSWSRRHKYMNADFNLQVTERNGNGYES